MNAGINFPGNPLIFACITCCGQTHEILRFWRSVPDGERPSCVTALVQYLEKQLFCVCVASGLCNSSARISGEALKNASRTCA
jgi:hypothetical protein